MNRKQRRRARLVSVELLVNTDAVSKRYKDVVALDRVDLAVPRGSVYGLVGPNGAGKTTMLGILAGLRKPTSGSIHVGTKSVEVLPDTPKFDGWLTGTEVVELSRTLADNGTPESAVDSILGAAGLSDAAGRKTRGYSRGMLQRLGLAAALVGGPDLLLLDEPAAALDPAGRREVLNLVTAMHGRSTVLFSSHILDDVQEVCDEIGILTRGQLVYQGSLDGLLDRHVSNRFIVKLRSGAVRAADILNAEPWVVDATAGHGENVTVAVSSVREAERRLVVILASIGEPVVSVNPESTSLEEVFLEVTA